MAGLGITVYTDEHITPQLAVALRTRGFDVLACHEVGRAGLSIPDDEQLAYAVSLGRTILTNNIKDFAPLDVQWKQQGRVHAGIMLYATTPSFSELLRRVIAHLETFTPEMQHDTVLWI